MQCTRCGRAYPSRYYFSVHHVCRDCFEQLSPEDQETLIRETESAGQIAAERFVLGNKLTCPVCGYDQFRKRSTLMNTPGMTFLGVEWANKQADNFICGKCGYVYWFMLE